MTPRDEAPSLAGAVARVVQGIPGMESELQVELVSVEDRDLDADDQARLGMETAKNPMVVTAVVRLGGRLDLEALIALLDERVLVHERMRSRIVPSGILHRLRWHRSADGARSHVTQVTLGPSHLADDALAALVSELMTCPLDHSSAPWRMWLIDGPANGSVLVLRIHHVIADGMSLQRLLFALSDEGFAFPPNDAPPPAPPKASGGTAHRAAALGRLLLRPSDSPSPFSGPLSGKKLVAWTAPIDVEALRRAAHAARAHINDVLLSVVAGALAEMAVSTGSPLQRAVHALVPIALADGDHPDAMALGNHFVSVFVRLPVDPLPPPVRVRAAHEAMRAARAESGISLGRTMLAGAAFVGGRAERAALGVLSRKASLVASNLAGPPIPLHLAGHPITDILFVAPAPGTIALSVNAYSYMGRLRIAVATDENVLPDPAALVRRIEAHANDTVATLLTEASTED